MSNVFTRAINGAGRVFRKKLSMMVAGSRFLTKVFYSILDPSFDDEMTAVLAGRKMHRDMLLFPSETNAQLRRNTHRLEKGLIMRPQRPLFAEDYIGVTVKYYKRAIAAGDFGDNEVRWAHDILERYFETVTLTDITSAAKAEFESHQISLPVEDVRSVPYRERQRVESAVSIEDLTTLLTKRRTVRWFKDETVPLEKIEQAIKLAAQAPSACNRQPFRFVVASSRAVAAEMAARAPGAKGFSEQIPMMVAIVGDLASYEFERDRHLIYIDGSLAAMQFLIALETLGLSSCILNWPDVPKNNKNMAQYMGLRRHERIIMQIGIGYADPDGKIPYSAKKEKRILMKLR